MNAAGGYAHPAPSVRIVSQALARPSAPSVRTVSQALVRRPVTPAANTLGGCYEVCRRVQAAHGRTYYVATYLLPRDRRPHVHALYAFARYADDLVDHLALDWSPRGRRLALEAWSREALAAVARGTSGDPVLRAASHTIDSLGIAHDDVRAFLRSMAMDLTVTRYPTYADLSAYMHGSAAVVGTMMLPILGARGPRARRPAMDLGVAFQLTNFLRDVAEDWDRGRIYLPLEDLDSFGVGERDFHARRVGPRFARLLAFEAARTRALYRSAEDGWALLPPASRRCIRVAHRLYGGILDALERNSYRVFDVRAVVPRRRRLAVVAREVVRRA